MNDILQSIYDSPIGTLVREDPYLFPTAESVHVLMIAAVVGTIAIVDLRLLGLGAHRKGARKLIVELLPYTWVAFVIAVISGATLFTSNAVQYAANGFFLAKMGALALAGVNMAVFHLGAYSKIGDWDETMPPPGGVRLAGAASLGLWILIIFLGRWIGFTMQ